MKKLAPRDGEYTRQDLVILEAGQSPLTDFGNAHIRWVYSGL